MLHVRDVVSAASEVLGSSSPYALMMPEALACRRIVLVSSDRVTWHLRHLGQRSPTCRGRVTEVEEAFAARAGASYVLSPGSTARQSITTGARQEPDSPDSPDTCQSTVPDTPDSKVGPHLDRDHVRPPSGGVRHVKQKPTARQPDSPTVAEQPDSSRQSSTVADSSTVRALDSGVYSYTSFLRART